MTKKNIWTVTFLAALIWIFIWWILGPQLGNGDISIFKEAGINWANGNGLTASFIPGNPTLAPKLYFSYPPAYPLLFGIFVKVFGFGPYENSFFNLGVGFICSFLWIYFLFQIFPKKITYLERTIFFIVLFLMPVGLLENSSDRPDVLAFTTLLTTLVLSKKKSSLAIIISFFIGGLSLAISPFVAIMNFTLLIFLYSKPLFKNTRLLIICLLALSLTGFAIFLFYEINDLSAFDRFFNHAFKQKYGAGNSIEAFKKLDFYKYLDNFKQSFMYLGLASIVTFISTLIFFIIIVFFLFSKKINSSKKSILAVPFSCFLISYIFFPSQIWYLTICRNFSFAILLGFFYGNQKKPIFLKLKPFILPLALLLLASLSSRFLGLSYLRFIQKNSYNETEAKVLSIRSLWPKDSEVTAIVPFSVYPLYRKYFKIIPLTLGETLLFENLNTDNNYLKNVKIYIPKSDRLNTNSINFIKKNKFFLYYEPETKSNEEIKIPGFNIKNFGFSWNKPIWIKQ